jgi:hypothetical protein
LTTGHADAHQITGMRIRVPGDVRDAASGVGASLTVGGKRALPARRARVEGAHDARRVAVADDRVVVNATLA